MSDSAAVDAGTRRTLGASASHAPCSTFRASGGTAPTSTAPERHQWHQRCRPYHRCQRRVHARPGDDAAHGPSQLAREATFDIAISGVCLVLLSPVLLVAAIGVMLTSHGPIVFRQPHVGRGGHIFTMYKFRTYPVDHVDDKFSREHDECPLTWGRFLRRTSIDELPQLWNVLRGDMSIVGPRPERPHFAGPLSDEVPGYERPAPRARRHHRRGAGGGPLGQRLHRGPGTRRQRLHRGVVVPA